MKARESSDPYYDLTDDWDLIVASFLTQYGIRLSTKEFKTVSWHEFVSLIAGIAPETPLGRVVAIRAETDKDTVKRFSREQKKIYDNWKKRGVKDVSPETYRKQMEDLEKMFKQLCL